MAFQYQLTLLLSALAFAACKPVRSYASSYAYGPGYVYGSGYPYGDYGHDAPAQYQFSYAVNDPKTGDIKSQVETADGKGVKGSYSLIEADGTKRTVDYFDVGHGFNAIVTKEGSPNNPVPSAPSHGGSPSSSYPSHHESHGAPSGSHHESYPSSGSHHGSYPSSGSYYGSYPQYGSYYGSYPQYGSYYGSYYPQTGSYYGSYYPQTGSYYGSYYPQTGSYYGSYGPGYGPGPVIVPMPSGSYGGSGSSGSSGGSGSPGSHGGGKPGGLVNVDLGANVGGLAGVNLDTNVGQKPISGVGVPSLLDANVGVGVLRPSYRG